MARKTLTDKKVADLPVKPKRYSVPDPELRGHYVRVTPNGIKTYVAVARDPHGKQVWTTIGGADLIDIEEARDKAREVRKRIKDGLPAFDEPPPMGDTFKTVAATYLKRHVKANGLRSQDEIASILKRHVYPRWQDRAFTDIRRADVAKLLDEVQDEHGAGAADHVLAIVRGIMNWYASRSDDYVSPITRGMRRTDPKSRKRARILDDDELRIVWKLAKGNGAFGAIIRLALLTAQRREKIAAMRWQDISPDGEWRIPAEEREKGNGGALVLPKAALTIIRARTRIEGNAYVFPGRGDGHFAGYSPCKRRFDQKVVETMREAAVNRGDDPDEVKPLENWTLHDCRRTARSLMARAGVRPDIAERVMGHAIQGVEGIYDRHSYRDEKADALKRLAGLIETILNPPAGNVVQLEAAHG